MRVADFIQAERNDLLKFEEYWKKQSEENPKQFPAEADMGHGEWWEQYMAWASNEGFEIPEGS